MILRRKAIAFLLGLIIPIITSGQTIDLKNIKKIRLKMYPAEGLVWKGESAQNTNWNKITETPDGKVWYCGDFCDDDDDLIACRTSYQDERR